MIKPTRRDFLTGTVGVAAGVAAIVILPAAPIVELTPVVTLASLAAENKYASVPHRIPDDVSHASFRFSLNGELLPERTYIQEIYAPGDDSGWAVMFDKIEPHDGPVSLVRGNWKMWRET